MVEQCDIDSEIHRLRMRIIIHGEARACVMTSILHAVKLSYAQLQTYLLVVHTCGEEDTECKHLQSLGTPRWIRTAETTTSHPWMAVLPTATSQWLSNLATSKAQHLLAVIRHKTTRRRATSTTTLVRRTRRSLRRIVTREADCYRPSIMDREVQHTAIPLDTVQQPR